MTSVPTATDPKLAAHGSSWTVAALNRADGEPPLTARPPTGESGKSALVAARAPGLLKLHGDSFGVAAAGGRVAVSR